MELPRPLLHALRTWPAKLATASQLTGTTAAVPAKASDAFDRGSLRSEASLSSAVSEPEGGTVLPPAPYLQLRQGDTSLLLDTSGPGLPSILHWGSDLGDVTDRIAPSIWGLPVPHGNLDSMPRLSILPELATGSRTVPGLSGHRDSKNWSPTFNLVNLVAHGPGSVSIHARDAVAQLGLRVDLTLSPSGVLEVQHTVRNEGQSDYSLERLAATLPIPPHATEVMDFTGRWCRERSPQRRELTQGEWSRKGVHGRSGHDNPFVVTAGTKGFGFRSGECWSIHLAWSGDHETYAFRGVDGQGSLGAAELLGPGEIVLAPGQAYSSPKVLAAHSSEGLDGVSRSFYQHVRARPSHPQKPRPVVLNTWEAVYFDQDLDKLKALAKAGAEVGIERFVLDDGWFRHRRNATAGLGDWYVDEKIWPEGLKPLIDEVKSLGMEFGLWVEPEMINPDSDLFRAHPDWVLAADDTRLPVPGRRQQVIDLVNPGAFDYLLGRLDSLLSENDIAYLKWDHNRDLVEAGHEGKPAVHEQTMALYRLLDELRARHPGVEIESCASGGGRVDLGILERTDRVWASDTNDALERQSIQRWTGLLLPPELVGAHVGPERSHTTGRIHSLPFRATTALFGHLGVEMDVTKLSEDDKAGLADAIRFYKEHRGLMHTGDPVRGDHADAAALVHGVVAPDKSEAIFAFVQVATSVSELPGPALFPGLDPKAMYQVTPVYPGGKPGMKQKVAPEWMAAGGVTLPGSMLEKVGLQMPVLMPEQTQLLKFTRVDYSSAAPIVNVTTQP